MEIVEARIKENAAVGPANVPWDEKRMLEQVKVAINDTKDKNEKVDPVMIVNLGTRYFSKNTGAMQLFINWTTVWINVGLKKGTASNCGRMH